MHEWKIAHIGVLDNERQGIPQHVRCVHVHMSDVQGEIDGVPCTLMPQYNVALFEVGNESHMECVLEVVGYLNQFVLKQYGCYTSVKGLQEGAL